MTVHKIVKAIIPEPYRILGLRLLPLSLGRYWLLRKFECAFVAEEKTDATMADLIIGLVICSMPVKEFLVFIQGPDAEVELAKWGNRIRAEIDADEMFNILSRFKLFSNYLADGYEVPAYLEEQSSDRQSGSHWSHSIAVMLRSKMGWTEEEVNEAPLSKAMADYFRWAESEGLIQILSDEQVAADAEQARANDAAMSELAKEVACPG